MHLAAVPAPTPAEPSELDAVEASVAADTRVMACIEVLRGASVVAVAARAGVQPANVERWLAAFLTAGAARVGGTQDSVRAGEVDRFLGLLVHELRTSLTVVRGWAELLASGGLDATGRAEAGHVVRRRIDAVEALTTDVRDSAVATLGRLDLQLKAVDLAGQAAQCVEATLDPRVRLAPHRVVHVSADERRVTQMLSALIAQARSRTSGPVVVGLDSDGVRASIRVTFEGSLTPDEAHRLFEPFPASEAEPSPGFGLGLYLVRALAVAHGGDVAVGADATSVELRLRLPLAGPSTTPTQ